MRTLTSVYDIFCSEVDDALGSFHQADGGIPRSSIRIGHHRASREGSVVYVYDAWGRFVRDAVMVSSCRKVTGIHGHEYGTPPHDTHRSAVAELRANSGSIANFQYGSPSWHLPKSALDAISVLRPPNQANLSGAIGGGIATTPGLWVADPVSDLHRIRNYICHKGPNAHAKMRPILVKIKARSVLELLDTPIGGIPLFEELAGNLKAIAGAAVA